MSNELTALHLSDNTLHATVTNQDGQGVEGASVEVSIDGPDGGEIVAGQPLTEDGGGDYSHTFPADTFEEEEEYYTAKVSVDTGSVERYAEVDIHNDVDDD